MVEKNNQIEMLDKIVQEFLAAQLRGEELALDEFVKQYPGLEKQIRQKVHNCQQVSSLFDSLREVDESEFKHPKDEIDLVGKQLSVDEKEITREASFVEDLGADSLDTVELIMSFEEEFDIEIPDEDAEKIRTVEDVISYIDKQVS